MPKADFSHHCPNGLLDSGAGNSSCKGPAVRGKVLSPRERKRHVGMVRRLQCEPWGLAGFGLVVSGVLGKSCSSRHVEPSKDIEQGRRVVRFASCRRDSWSSDGDRLERKGETVGAPGLEGVAPWLGRGMGLERRGWKD